MVHMDRSDFKGGGMNNNDLSNYHSLKIEQKFRNADIGLSGERRKKTSSGSFRRMGRCWGAEDKGVWRKGKKETSSCVIYKLRKDGVTGERTWRDERMGKGQYASGGKKVNKIQ